MDLVLFTFGPWARFSARGGSFGGTHRKNQGRDAGSNAGIVFLWGQYPDTGIQLPFGGKAAAHGSDRRQGTELQPVGRHQA